MEAGLLTGPEVAALCRVSAATVRSWVQREQLAVAGIDSRGRNLFRQLDAARCEAATRKKAGRQLPGLAA